MSKYKAGDVVKSPIGSVALLIYRGAAADEEGVIILLWNSHRAPYVPDTQRWDAWDTAEFLFNLNDVLKNVGV